MPTFTREEVQFRYYDEGGGRPLLFMHGLGSSLSKPVDILSDLPGVRLLSLDFRGHGHTLYEGPPSAYQIPVFSEDALALLDHVGIERAVVGGISLGAAVALHLAIHHPGRVRALIMVRPAWLNHPYPVNLDLLVRIGRWVELHGVEAARARLLADENFREIFARVPAAADALLGQLRRPHIAFAYESLMRLPASVPFLDWEELKRVDVPALVLSNVRDPLHPVHYGRQLAGGLPRGEWRQAPSRYVDEKVHERKVRKLIAEFLGRLDGGVMKA